MNDENIDCAFELEQALAQIVEQQNQINLMQDELKNRDKVLKEFMELTGVISFYDWQWWSNKPYESGMVEAFVEANDAISSTKDLREVMKAIGENEVLNSQWLRLLATMRLTS